MKLLSRIGRLIFTVVQLAASSALLAQQAPAPAPAAPKSDGPHIRFSETNFDFGKVKFTDTPRHDFIVTNTGNTVLEITEVKPGCGCTTAGAWDHQVQPGQTGKIPIQFNPASFSGTVGKSVTVTCNDPAQGTHLLQIQATVWRPIEVQPAYTHFLAIEGETTNDTKVVRIINNLEEAITLEPPQSSSPIFKTELKTLKPGKEFELHVTYAGPVSNASPHSTITIKTSSTNMPVLNVSAYAMPQPALVAMPPQIQLPPGPFSPEYRYPAMIRNNGSTPVKVSEPAVNAEGVTVQVQETQPGKLFTLNLSFAPTFKAMPGQPLELTVKTTHPKYPILRVPILQAAAPAPAIPAPVAASK